MLETIIWALIIGIILGPLARLILPGRQDIGILWTILAGFIGALIGGFIARALGVDDTKGIDWLQGIIEIITAVIAVAAIAAWKGGQASTTRRGRVTR